MSTHEKMMREWDGGILTAPWYLLYTPQFDNDSGLRELRAKVCAKAGISPNLCHLSLFAESCYGSRAVEISRKFLDSGALRDFVVKDIIPAAGGAWNTEVTLRFHLVLACAMSLGCTLPEEMTALCGDDMFGPEALEAVKKTPEGSLNVRAFIQLRDAYASYVPGIPAKYGNESYQEGFAKRYASGQGTITLETYGCFKLVKHLANGKYTPLTFGPLTEHEGVSTGSLRTCLRDGGVRGVRQGEQDWWWKSRCLQRLYPAEKMKEFMDSIPLDFASDANSMKELKKHL